MFPKIPKKVKLVLDPEVVGWRREKAFQNEQALIHKHDAIRNSREEESPWHIILTEEWESEAYSEEVWDLQGPSMSPSEFWTSPTRLENHKSILSKEAIQHDQSLIWRNKSFSGVRNEWEDRGVSRGQNSQLECLPAELEETNQDSDGKEKNIRELWARMASQLDVSGEIEGCQV